MLPSAGRSKTFQSSPISPSPIVLLSQFRRKICIASKKTSGLMAMGRPPLVFNHHFRHARVNGKPHLLEAKALDPFPRCVPRSPDVTAENLITISVCIEVQTIEALAVEVTQV